MSNNLPPVATSKIALSVNLDSRSKVMPEEFDNNAEKTSNFNTTMNIFDSQGRSHSLTMYFKRLEDAEGITWQYHAAVDAGDVTDADSGASLKEIGKGIVKFTPDGQLLAEEQSISLQTLKMVHFQTKHLTSTSARTLVLKKVTV